MTEEVFESFTKHWINRETPNINQDNLLEYEQLSEEFDRMRDIIEIFKKHQQTQSQNIAFEEEKQVQENIIQSLRNVIAKKNKTSNHILKHFLKNDLFPAEINNNENRYDLYLAIVEENVKKIDLLINNKFATYRNVLYLINEKEKTASVYNFDFFIKSLTIPEYIEYNSIKFRVTTILENSFKNKLFLDSVSCRSIERIEKGAFDTPISKMILSSNVELEDGWFKYLSNYTDIQIIPNGNQRIAWYDDKFLIGKSDPKSDKYDVIYFVKNNFDKILIPSFIKQISPFAFYRSQKLHEVVIQSNSEPILISKNAFLNSGINHITLPSNCELEDGWMKGIFNLTTIEIVPNKDQRITWFDDKLIIGKSDPKSDKYDVIHFAKISLIKITIPSFIKRIASFAFSKCINLKEIEFEDDSELEIIGKCAFELCVIEKISIPRNVTHIMKLAFNKSQLKKIEFSKESKLKVIGKCAFNEILIDDIAIPSTVIEFGDDFLPKTITIDNIKIMQNNRVLAKYGQFFILGKSNPGNELYDVLLFAQKDIEVAVIPSFIKRIARSAFEKCSKLQLIEFEGNSQLQVIDKSAFSELSIKVDITIPPSVIHIKQDAFSNCANIRSLDFQESSMLCLIGEAFFGSNIGCISLRSNFLKIKSEAFFLSKIQIIEVSESVKSFCIHPNAFIHSEIGKIMIPPNLIKPQKNLIFNKK